MRKTIGRLVVAALLSTIALVGATTPAHAVNGYVSRTATVSPDPNVWEPITPEMRSGAAGQNLYIRFDRSPESIYVKWVKCGYTATQNAASSVGGQAVLSAKNNEFQGSLGTGFAANSCVKIWARAVYQLSYRPSFPMEAYFNNTYIP